MSNPTVVAPTSETDPFCDEVLADPSAMHRELREAGPVVWLARYEVFATAHGPGRIFRCWSLLKGPS